MTTIYIVQANGKVSQEAYASLQEAQDFITERTGIHFDIDKYAMNTTDPFTGTIYEIHDVRVR